MMEVEEESVVYVHFTGESDWEPLVLILQCIDPDTLLRFLIREVSPSASSTSGLSWNVISASVF